MTNKKSKPATRLILTVCIPCGQKNDRKHKQSFGAWIDDCDMCKEKNVPCASAPHDFGIYSNKEIEADDRGQDII